MKLPGLSFSWRRAVGLTALKASVSRRVGIPLTRAGRERKVGKAVLSVLAAIVGKRRP
jgi:hypothetical protein